MLNINTIIRTVILSCLLSYASATGCNYQQSVTADFAKRDKMPQYSSAKFHDSWGPKSATYPKPQIPSNCDPVKWQQQRIIAVAKKYIGLPYQHHHIPSYSDGSGVGLDCSNFTSWVYNYGLGIKFPGGITSQANTVGRQLTESEAFAPGDLLFIRTRDDSRISHVVIYIDPLHIIDDHANGVQMREFKGWYKNHLAYGRRVIN